MDIRSETRKRRLRVVFEGRQRQLEAERSLPWPPTAEQRRSYGIAIGKYDRARKAWRTYRGWR
jgi:hypothetical protein